MYRAPFSTGTALHAACVLCSGRPAGAREKRKLQQRKITLETCTHLLLRQLRPSRVFAKKKLTVFFNQNKKKRKLQLRKITLQTSTWLFHTVSLHKVSFFLIRKRQRALCSERLGCRCMPAASLLPSPPTASSALRHFLRGAMIVGW